MSGRRKLTKLSLDILPIPPPLTKSQTIVKSTKQQVLIGKGGSGRITLHQNEMGKKTACKRCKPQLLQRQFHMLKKVQREINQESKQNIITPIQLHLQDGDPRFHMQYQPDYLSLDIILKETPDILTDECIHILSRDLRKTIHHLHEAEIVHTDIKPGNILVDPKTCKFKLIDFGSARSREEMSLPYEGTYIYTSPLIIQKFSSPETIQFEDLILNDQWATELVIEQLRTRNPENLVLRELNKKGQELTADNILIKLAIFFKENSMQQIEKRKQKQS